MTTLTNAQVREALHKSIQKWSDVAYKGKEDHGTEDCALCEIFWANVCKGCPIREYTGIWGCEGSPYMPWLVANRNDLIPSANTPRKKQAAEAMLTFLRNLDYYYFVKGVKV